MTEMKILRKSGIELTKFDYSKLGYQIEFQREDPPDPNLKLGYWTITSPNGKLSGFTEDGIIESIVYEWCTGNRCQMLQEIDKHVTVEVILEADLLLMQCEIPKEIEHDDELVSDFLHKRTVEGVDNMRDLLRLPPMKREETDNG